jgi:hypothetical protein
MDTLVIMVLWHDWCFLIYPGSELKTEFLRTPG